MTKPNHIVGLIEMLNSFGPPVGHTDEGRYRRWWKSAQRPGVIEINKLDIDDPSNVEDVFDVDSERENQQ